MEERLQKLIAHAGVASRRAAEELIINGRVTVNGERATLGMKANPDEDHIKVNGKLINIKIEQHENVYILLNKPKGVLTSVLDPNGRKLVVDFVPKKFGKLHPVGRLDYQSEGLILMTNDGAFTQKVNGSKTIAKLYEIKVKGLPPEPAVNKLRRGVELDDGFKTSPCEIKTLQPTKTNAWFEVTLYEGHNQQIRKMFDAIGHSVVKLRRIAIGNLRDDLMPIGAFRVLDDKEVKAFLTGRMKATSTKAGSTKSTEEAEKLAKHTRSLKPKKVKYKKVVS
jgi:23S rRNA pseudouridine2605 synthase